MISNIVNQALMDTKLAALARGIISHSFTSMPEETIEESLEKCTANGSSYLFVPFTYPPLFSLFDTAAAPQTHEFPSTPSFSSILNNKGYIEFENELEKNGFYVSALLVGRDHAEMTITKAPPAIPLRGQSEIKLG